jgi:agmatine/peptidylarginine deiminase
VGPEGPSCRGRHRGLFALAALALCELACSGARPPRPEPPSRQTPLATLERQNATAGLADSELGLAGSPEDETLWGGPEAEPGPGGEREIGRLRGDWESGNALFITYDTAWEASLAELIRAASAEVDVFVVVNPADLRAPSFHAWTRGHAASVVVAPHDTPWIRDYGPVLLRRDGGRIEWVDFQYSSERMLDDRVPVELGAAWGIGVRAHPLWLDGGAIASNGDGLCAITATNVASLGLESRRGEDLSTFMSTLGCRAVAVLPALPGEETGHVDLIVQFVEAGRAAISRGTWAEPPEVSRALDESARILEETAAWLGQRLELVDVPLRVKGGVFYSYVNFTRLPGRALIPSYRALGAAVEARAHAALARALGQLRLVPIPADLMAERGGAIHCVTLGVDLPSIDEKPSGRGERERNSGRRASTDARSRG